LRDTGRGGIDNVDNITWSCATSFFKIVNDDVYQNTKDLLDLSVINYNKVVNSTSELTPDIADDNKSEECTFATDKNTALAKEYEVTVHETAALAKESQITVHEIDMIDEESVVTVFHNDRRT